MNKTSNILYCFFFLSTSVKKKGTKQQFETLVFFSLVIHAQMQKNTARTSVGAHRNIKSLSTDIVVFKMQQNNETVSILQREVSPSSVFFSDQNIPTKYE